MPQLSWNLRTSTSTSFDVRGVVWLTVLTVGLLLYPRSVGAVGPTPGPFLTPPSRASGAEDRRVEIRVRVALSKDEKLKSLNLGVRMTSGIAHLFGPLPSPEYLVQAREVVGQVSGVLEVRASEVYFAKRREEAKSLPLPLEDDKPTQTRSASPKQLAGALGSLTGRDPWTPAPANQAPSVLRTPTSQPDVAVALQPASSTPSSISLLEPEAMLTPSRRAEPALLTAKPRTPKPAPSIPAAIDRLRQQDSRFRPIRTEVRGTTVRIFSGETPGEKVMAFAQAITRLPGVERVVVQDTSFRPR